MYRAGKQVVVSYSWQRTELLATCKKSRTRGYTSALMPTCASRRPFRPTAC